MVSQSRLGDSSPYRNMARRPSVQEVPSLRGGGLLIVFDDRDQPVLPRFRADSAGEVRKASWFRRSGDDTEWWWTCDEGCSDQWLASHPPAFLEEELTPPNPLTGYAFEQQFRVIVWTPDREVLRDQTLTVRGQP